MKLPKDLLSDSFTKPQIFLCEVDKKKICELDTQETQGTFKFNSYSELSFDVSRTYINQITGEQCIHPFYNKIEALRLIYMPNFGYFEIQEPKITSDGIKEIKSVSAYSLEYQLSQKYLNNFVINNPDNEMNIGGGTPSSSVIDALVQLYDETDSSHSLLDLAIEKAPGWSIGYVDSQLKTQTRSFEIDRESIYDFLVDDVAETFKCHFIFDTINNTINVYADARIVKFYGDGTTTSFTISPVFSDLGAVTIDGYKTLEYSYDNQSGVINFVSAPEDNSIIEIEDGSMSEYETDVFVSFENLATEMEIDYDADDIKTVLQVTGSDDMDIREVNMGFSYLMDLSYYHTMDWMGQDLYDAYAAYLKLLNRKEPLYNELLLQEDDEYDVYYELQNRISTELTMSPDLQDFKTMLQYYYKYKNIDIDDSGNQLKIDGITVKETIYNEFNFLSKYTYEDGTQFDITAYMNQYLGGVKTLDEVKSKTLEVLKIAGKEFGTSYLNIFIQSFENIQQTQIDAGYSTTDSKNYNLYWANYLMLSGFQLAIDERQAQVDAKMADIEEIDEQIAAIVEVIAMEKNFTKAQLIKLSAFMREDEYNDSNFLITDDETNADIVKSKKELLQCGKIELQSLCEPNLSFDATMANIYALEEFEPIINQFQLGNLIRIALRDDYIKKTRIMEVNFNFDDFSRFSVTFGDLISAKSAIDIHADLLEQAANAGKSVASNSSYWNKGYDLATSTDIKIHNGLLDANTRIKDTSGEQGVYMDKYGLHLQKINSETGEVDPKQAWLINNLLCYTDDNWETTKAALGEINIDDKTYYGLIAEAVLSGYIEGSKIVGGTINIGDGVFQVNEDGTVTINSCNNSSGLGKTVSDASTKAQAASDSVAEINKNKMYRVTVESSDRNIMTTKGQSATLICKVYSWDEDITDKIDAKYFYWKRTSSKASSDTEWNNNTRHQGIKQITITTEDIQNNASFRCELIEWDGELLDS